MPKSLLPILGLATLLAAAQPVTAQSAQRIATQDAFAERVVGRDLTRLGIRLQVTPGGRISGNAFGARITGSWSWQDGFFCREMAWGSRSFEPNCQEVVVGGGRVTFIADRGAGDSAYLNLP